MDKFIKVLFYPVFVLIGFVLVITDNKKANKQLYRLIKNRK